MGGGSCHAEPEPVKGQRLSPSKVAHLRIHSNHDLGRVGTWHRGTSWLGEEDKYGQLDISFSSG